MRWPLMVAARVVTALLLAEIAVQLWGMNRDLFHPLRRLGLDWLAVHYDSDYVRLQIALLLVPLLLAFYPRWWNAWTAVAAIVWLCLWGLLPVL